MPLKTEFYEAGKLATFRNGEGFAPDHQVLDSTLSFFAALFPQILQITTPIERLAKAHRDGVLGGHGREACKEVAKRRERGARARRGPSTLDRVHEAGPQ